MWQSPGKDSILGQEFVFVSIEELFFILIEKHGN